MKMKNSQVMAWPLANTDVLPDRKTASVSGVLADLLWTLGVEKSFGVVGGGNAPFAEALLKSPMCVYHTRHEAGAAFAATEACFATNKPAAVFVTTGPGLLNSLVGICAARWDGSKLVLVSGSTNPKLRGRGAVQETSSYTMPIGSLFATGVFFDFAVQMHDAEEIDEIARRLQMGFDRPQGFVAHISLPIGLQTKMLPDRPVFARASSTSLGCHPSMVEKCSNLLAGDHFAIWIGFGARHAADEILGFAEQSGAAVMCTPRAKGVFPETHSQYVGVTGAGGHESVEIYMDRHKPVYTLVLGTRLGEASSFWNPKLIPRKGFIHVDVDPGVPGIAFPDVPVIGLQAEIQSFVRTLADVLPPVSISNQPDIEPLALPQELAPRKKGKVRPQFLMQSLQKMVINGSDTIIMSESGNSFGWANHYLRFTEPGRYRTSAEFGSMGHMATGVVGAALARKGRALALVGDGAMLMNNELSTAVRYGAQAIWVVMNDSRYGITQQAMQAQGFLPVETELPPTDFSKFARSVGGDGIRVERESELDAALERTLSSKGPIVLDVAIDREEVSPVLRGRIESLKKQGGVGSKQAKTKCKQH